MIRQFNRYELKYVLPLGRAARVIEDLKPQIAPDRYGGERGYPVVSLYYDSPDYSCFWSKIEGLRFRRKVRVRIYPDGDVGLVRGGAVEIKQRVNKTGQKRRRE